MKRFWVLFVLLLCCFAVFGSYRTELGLEYTYSFSDNAHLGTVRTDFVWNKGSFSFGGLVGLGYGTQHYVDSGSSALIYGPTVSLGLQGRYDLGLCEVGSDVRATVAYALFPVILRGQGDLDVLFNLGSRWKAGIGYGYFFDVAKDTYRGPYSGASSSVHVIFGVLL